MVPFQIYEYMNSLAYVLLGVFAAAPCVLLPWFFQPPHEAKKPWYERHWVKANVWVAVYSFIGNYFWTHYFYQLLGADYTFPSDYQRLNNVPFSMYLFTHAYFAFYHVVANLLLRRTRRALVLYSPVYTALAQTGVIFILAYVLAFLETFTISNFPYYTNTDKARMYTVGSLFYAIYFFVSFPLFYRIDEGASVVSPFFSGKGVKGSIGQASTNTWTAGSAFMDSMAAGMICTIILDLWRLVLGGITKTTAKRGIRSGIIWAFGSQK